MPTCSINLSKQDALKLAHYLGFVQLGNCIPFETQEEVFEMQNITTEVINQIADQTKEG